jgi:hypothetical protein
MQALVRVPASLMDDLRWLLHHENLAGVKADNRHVVVAPPEIDELVAA